MEKSANDPSVRGNGDNVQRDRFAAIFQRGFNSERQSAAAGDSHPGHGDRADIIVCKNLGQLLGIVHTVQLGAGNQRCLVFHKFVVEISVAVGSAIGSDQQVSAVKPRGIDRCQFDLNGKILKPAGQVDKNFRIFLRFLFSL